MTYAGYVGFNYIKLNNSKPDYQNKIIPVLTGLLKTLSIHANLYLLFLMFAACVR